MYKYAVLSLFIPSLVYCQGSPLYNSDFSGGLNTYQSSLLINQNESPDLQNVILDKSGSLDRRQGYIKLNTTAIGGGSADVNYIFDFDPSNGTKYCVAFSSASGYFSTDGCQTFTTFVSTLTVGNDVSCDTLNDKLVCVNNQYNFSFTGSATTQKLNGDPSALQYIRVFNNQCFAAGNSSNPSRLFYSNIGDCTTWNITTQYIDIAANNGDVITGIGPAIYGGFTVYKKFSTWYVTQVGSSGNGPVFQVINISPNTGVKNHRSIANLFQEQLFDSVGPYGGQPGIYAFDGIKVYEKTKKLRNSFDLIGTFLASFGQISFNTQSQFLTGNLCVAGTQACMTATQSVGMLQPSTSTFTDTATTFLNGTLVHLATTSANTIGLVQPKWNTFNNVSGEIDGTTNWTFAGSPAWSRVNAGATFEWNNPASLPATLNFRILDASSNVLFSKSYTVSSSQSGSLKYDGSITGVCLDGTDDLPLPAVLSSNTNAIELQFNIGSSTMTSVPFIRGNGLCIQVSGVAGGPLGGVNVYSIGSPNLSATTISPLPFVTTGSYQAPVFDTGFLTPVWGVFNTNLSSNSASAITFSGSAGATNSAFGAFSSLTNQVPITVPNNEFFIYYATFTVNTATNTLAALTSDTIVAADTGTWKSAETFTSNSMSSWKLFQTNQTTTGNGTITYAVQTSTYAGGTPFAAVVPITPGSAITASTGAYVTLISSFSVLNSTEVASVSNMTLNWQQGGSATTPSAAVFANRYHYGCVSTTGTNNDTIYVLDINGAWVKWTDVFPRSLAIVNQNMMMGGSQTTAGGFIYQMYNSDADNGGAINSYYNTKDMSLGDISHIKNVNQIMLAYGSNATTLNVDLFRDTNQGDLTYTFNTNTGSLFGVNWRNVEIPNGGTDNGNTFRLKLSNNAANAPWRVLGYGLAFQDQGMMTPF